MEDSDKKEENTGDSSVNSRKETAPAPPPRGRGRPSKADLKKAKAPGKVGRPPGTAAIMNEYKNRMLASPKSRKVLDKIFEAALDDEHKHQAACMKMIADRLLPVVMFEQEVAGQSGSNKIQISFSKVSDGESITISSRSEKEIEGEAHYVSEESFTKGEEIIDAEEVST